MTINATKLDRELRAAGVPIHGCASSGRVDYTTAATAGDRDRAAQVIAAHDPTPEAQDRCGILEALAVVVRDGALAPTWARALVDAAAARARP